MKLSTTFIIKYNIFATSFFLVHLFILFADLIKISCKMFENTFFSQSKNLLISTASFKWCLIHRDMIRRDMFLKRNLFKSLNIFWYHYFFFLIKNYKGNAYFFIIYLSFNLKFIILSFVTLWNFISEKKKIWKFLRLLSSPCISRGIILKLFSVYFVIYICFIYECNHVEIRIFL